MQSASLGRIELIEMLLDLGCDVDETDEDEKTPLMYALESKFGDNADVVEKFIKSGAKVNK